RPSSTRGPHAQIKGSKTSPKSSSPPEKATTSVNVPRRSYMGRRLGNHMFEYAATYGIARMNNQSAVIHVTNYHTMWDIFAHLTLPRSSPLSNMTKMSAGKYATYNSIFEKLPNSNVHLRGYFQSWKYFQRYQHYLRQEFAFKKVIRRDANDYLLQIARTYIRTPTARNITFVGVHVKRGDRVRSQLYRVASKSYITRAMDDFRRNFTRVHFVVCSDDISWCKEHLGQQKNVSFSVGRSAIEDFVVLSLCNHTLSTVGTYSWWVGWLAGGATTYYVNHGNVSTHIYRHLKADDFFLPGWIPMSD
ncbi:Galactoside 2-alpha-L-fucosyltransferase 2, partial [Lamellibrachia satsuma]